MDYNITKFLSHIRQLIFEKKIDKNDDWRINSGNGELSDLLSAAHANNIETLMLDTFTSTTKQAIENNPDTKRREYIKASQETEKIITEIKNSDYNYRNNDYFSERIAEIIQEYGYGTEEYYKLEESLTDISINELEENIISQYDRLIDYAENCTEYDIQRLKNDLLNDRDNVLYLIKNNKEELPKLCKDIAEKANDLERQKHKFDNEVARCGNLEKTLYEIKQKMLENLNNSDNKFPEEAFHNVFISLNKIEVEYKQIESITDKFKHNDENVDLTELIINYHEVYSYYEELLENLNRLKYEMYSLDNKENAEKIEDIEFKMEVVKEEFKLLRKKVIEYIDMYNYKKQKEDEFNEAINYHTLNLESVSEKLKTEIDNYTPGITVSMEENYDVNENTDSRKCVKNGKIIIKKGNNMFDTSGVKIN